MKKLLLFLSLPVFLAGNCPNEPENSNENQADAALKDCPTGLKQRLVHFEPKIEKIKNHADELRKDQDEYTISELNAMASGDPVGYAANHCNDTDEIMKFSQDKCLVGGQTKDIKAAKETCQVLKNISQTAYGLQSKINSSFTTNAELNQEMAKKPSALSNQDVKDIVNNFINAIKDNF